MSNALASVSKSRYCDNDEALHLSNACKFLDKLTSNDSVASDGSESVDDTADAIMALPTELRLLAESDEDASPTKRLRLAVEDPLPPSVPAESLPSATTDPYSPSPIGELPASGPSLSSDPPIAAPLCPPPSATPLSDVVGLQSNGVGANLDRIDAETRSAARHRLRGKQVASTATIVSSHQEKDRCQAVHSI